MPSLDNDADLIRSLQAKLANLNARKKALETALAVLRGKPSKPYTPHKPVSKRKLSAAARKAMSEGARKAAAARKKAAQG